jgi:glycosyltransferase involved in cell wall biosynthesis
MVLTRAFAGALPVIASDIPGYREVLDPSASVSVRPGDRAELVDAVCELVADEERRAALGAAAREIAVAKYSWPGIARRLSLIYERVTGLEPGQARAA